MGYPARLLELRTPPAVYLRGELTPRPRVAIVGSRRAGMDALRLAERLGRRCANAGISVVSGGAFGVDAAAHRGALAEGGATLVVLPTPLAAPSPRAHAGLFNEILEQGGGWITEWGSGPVSRGAFASRNRLIAALADAVVVVQAGPRSGTLHTARSARRLGRRLFVFPWSLLEPRACSNFEILRAGGAEVLTDLEDVIRLGRASALVGRQVSRRSRRPGARFAVPTEPAPMSIEESTLVDALREGPQAAEAIAARLRCSVRQVLVSLARLEVRGVVRALPGGVFGCAGD